MKVLVIDDDEVACELLAGELRGAGFQVVSLPSPIGATNVLQNDKMDAIVVDVVMPTLRGDRLAKLLRGNPRFAQLAVILVSGESGVELDELVSAVGADAVLSKADVRIALPATVRAAIRARTRAAVPQPGATGQLSPGPATRGPVKR